LLLYDTKVVKAELPVPYKGIIIIVRFHIDYLTVL